jgi:hypothetical protein
MDDTRRAPGSSRGPTKPRDPRPAPPLSLTTVWDKAKWHADAETFPAHLPRTAARAHILAALRVLDERAMLTAEGRRELADELGEDTALLDEHVRRPARAFLDAHYQSYLGACDYGAPPAVGRLETAWADYHRRYDLRKRIRPDAYQALLLGTSDHTLGALLHRVRLGEGALLDSLRTALPHVPLQDRALVEAVLDVTATAGAQGAPIADPATRLRALAYVPAARAPAMLGTVATLARALGLAAEAGAPDAPRSEERWVLLQSVAGAVNLPDWRAAPPAVAALTAADRDLLARLVDELFVAGDHRRRFLAICAMRSVGDERSLRLLRRHPPTAAEGVIERARQPPEPWSAAVRQEAQEAITARLPGPT